MKLANLVSRAAAVALLTVAGLALTTDRALATATVPCVDGGPGAADAALADELRPRLQDKMRYNLHAHQVSCAREVVETIRDVGLNTRAAVIAITTTIVESSISNISVEKDHTSLGLFQQQDFWGSRAQRLDPDWATRAFLRAMIERFPDNSWMNQPVGEVCQAVQRSRFPDRYAEQVADAAIIVDALWNAQTVSVYGVLPDGRVTYSSIEPATGNRIKTVKSALANTLGFTPRAMAALNFNTLLVTSTEGELYRVDVITNRKEPLVFNRPKLMVASGWTHRLLTFDGTYLYGIAGDAGLLVRYKVSGDKPTAQSITGRTVIAERGFTLRTLTASAPGWILGTTVDGRLLSYHIRGAGAWAPGHELRARDWGLVTHLVSPGGGFYYARTGSGAMFHYRDADPTDGSGGDLTGDGDDPVDREGWTQTLLSAQPFGT